MTGYRAGDEIRTRDILLGKQTLYQLSYTRLSKAALKMMTVRQLFYLLQNRSRHFHRRLKCIITPAIKGISYLLE